MKARKAPRTSAQASADTRGAKRERHERAAKHAQGAVNQDNLGQKVTINARGAARIRAGHPWVYRSDVVSSDGANAGAVVAVTDPTGKLLGSALYSSASQIA